MEQRRTQRYKLQLPLRIVQIGGMMVSRVGKTRDISSGGVCFLSPRELSVGGRIEYVITLSPSNPPVRIRCLGKVMRNRQTRPGSLYEVAVTLGRYQFIRPETLKSSAAGA